jgi:hypothetical protein
MPFYAVTLGPISRPGFGAPPNPGTPVQVWSTGPNDSRQIISAGANQTIYHADRSSPFAPDPIPANVLVSLEPSVTTGRLWITGCPGWESILTATSMREQPGCRDF